MNDTAVGSALRDLRERRGWRQRDLAERANASQSLVSLVERGIFARMSFGAMRRVFAALDARLELRVFWQAGEIDRLADGRHAAIVESVIRVLQEAGWQVRAEVPFSVFGDRGSVDVLAWHAASGAVLLIEVKSQLYSVEETLRSSRRRSASLPKSRRTGWAGRPASWERHSCCPRAPARGGASTLTRPRSARRSRTGAASCGRGSGDQTVGSPRSGSCPRTTWFVLSPVRSNACAWPRERNRRIPPPALSDNREAA